MKNVFVKILEFLKITQTVSNEERHKNGLKRLGKGFFNAYRLNPFNPLSYILIILTIPVVLLLYGFVGVFKELINPFKWN